MSTSNISDIWLYKKNDNDKSKIAPFTLIKNVYFQSPITTDFYQLNTAETESISDFVYYLTHNNGYIDTSRSIENGSIDGVKIKNKTISDVNIQDGVIQGKHLQNDMIETIKIKDNAISTSKIQDYAVTSTKIADNTITSTKIVDNTITYNKISKDGHLDLFLKDVVNNGGQISGSGDPSITTNNIKPKSIGTKEIADSAITRKKLETDIINDLFIICDTIIKDHNGDSTLNMAAIRNVLSKYKED